jgi:HPt (histidine-containing phosphotransfer) domain-containing protein
MMHFQSCQLQVSVLSFGADELKGSALGSSRSIDMVGMLNELWNQYRELIQGRLNHVREAVKAAEKGLLTAELRDQGMQDAHKLAGSLGAFGLEAATESARQIEEILKEKPLLLSEHLSELRTLLSTLETGIASRR